VSQVHAPETSLEPHKDKGSAREHKISEPL